MIAVLAPAAMDGRHFHKKAPLIEYHPRPYASRFQHEKS
jgi:hypothetical protein